jgi:hypothetical protein
VCFCMQDASGNFLRGCRAVKFPNQAHTIAQCRDPESGDLSGPIPITRNWTVVTEGESGCEVCWPETQDTGGTRGEDSTEGRVVASRLFAGPSQYPPDKFAAYGILAFRSRAASHDRARHLMLCEAYVVTLPHASELAIAVADQMTTVWPIDSDREAEELNRVQRTEMCETAVDHYGLATALQALKDAERAGMKAFGIGPFLLAWSPSRAKGKPNALVLVADLSDVTTFRQAQELLLKWSDDIEQDPSLWRRGWDLERVRLKIRLWVDDYGPRILALFGAKE